MLKRISTPEALVASAEDKKLRWLSAPSVAASSTLAGGEAQSERCKYLQRRSAPRLRSRSNGFSLIEVVIALGVFLFGALAIVRIFPGALGVIQTSERRNVAQRMNQTSLARYTTAPLSVPEAIVDVHPNLYDPTTNETGWSDFSGAVSGSPNRNASLPSNPAAQDDISTDNSQPVSTQLTSSAAGRFRRIIGEEHTVTQEIVGGIVRGVITLRYPYVQPAAISPDEVEAVHQPLLFRSIAIDGVTINRIGELDFSDATANGTAVNDPASIDPRRVSTAFRIVTPSFPNRQPVTFYVSYRWHVGAGPINGIVDEPKRFPIDASWGLVAPPAPQGAPAQVLQAVANSTAPGFGTTGFRVVEGPVQVKMRRLESSSPLAPQQELDRNLGRIIVDSSLVGERLSVDYSVPDWRMIVHDDNLSTTLSTDDQDFLQRQDPAYTFGATGTVANARVTTVPTKFITDEAVSASTPLASRPSQTYALIKGTAGGAIVSTSGQWSPDPGKFAAPSQVDYGAATPAARNPRVLAVRPKPGQVFFDVSTLAAPSARVVYRNLDGWLEQPSVAARSYVPFVDRTSIGATGPVYWPREPWREYFYNPVLANTSSANHRKAIVLRAADAGQTFLVTYVFTNTANPATKPKLMRDVPVTAQANVEEINTLGFLPAGFLGSYREGSSTNAASGAALLYLPDESGAKMGLPINEGGTSDASGYITSIQSIKGASIRVRSAWFDGGRYSQNDVSGYRSLDVESNSRS